jgi:hypothetical protein
VPPLSAKANSAPNAPPSGPEFIVTAHCQLPLASSTGRPPDRTKSTESVGWANAGVANASKTHADTKLFQDISFLSTLK